MILITYGTRPEWIKVKKLIEKLKKVKNIKVLFTGQHKDLISESSPDYFHEFTEYNDNRLNSIIINMLNLNENFWKEINYVIVQGDTGTAFGVALAAKNRGLKVIHLEAGLRTYDKENPFPEEMYRQMISKISDIHLCPTKKNKENLLNEKVSGKVYVTGNTVLDNIVNIKTKYENKILVTLHRRENLNIIDKWFNEIDNLASKYKNLEFLLPIHPNPEIKKFSTILKNVKVVDSLNHQELINYLKDVKLVITDSGGIQEEASFFNKRIIVCRKITERDESLNKHSFMCESPDKLIKLFDKLINKYQVKYKCPYGDGKSVNKIVNILKKL